MTVEPLFGTRQIGWLDPEPFAESGDENPKSNRADQSRDVIQNEGTDDCANSGCHDHQHHRTVTALGDEAGKWQHDFRGNRWEDVLQNYEQCNANCTESFNDVLYPASKVIQHNDET